MCMVHSQRSLLHEDFVRCPLVEIEGTIPQGGYGLSLHQISLLVMKLLSNHQNQSDEAAASQPSVGLRHETQTCHPLPFFL